MNFVGNPRVHFPIFVEHAFRTNETRGVEDVTGPLRIDFEHRAALNVDVVFFGFLLESFRVLVWNRDGEFVD